MGAGVTVTVRRQWAPWRTPWVWRKIRARSKPHRGYTAERPPLFSYSGDAGDAGSFVAGALNQLVGGSPLNAAESAHPGAFLAGQVADMATTSTTDALFSGAGPGGGSAGGSASGPGGGSVFDGVGLFDDLDEAALVILGIVALALFLIVAIPLGIMAVEIIFALLAVLVGIALRVAHVRPWTILVRQAGATTAAFSVTGWTASHRVLVGLREQRSTLALAATRSGWATAPPAGPAPGPPSWPAHQRPGQPPVI